MSKIVRKNNYASSFSRKYSFGGGFKDGIGGLNLDATGLGAALGKNIGAIGSAVGGVAGGLLSNGLESGVGSTFNTIGDLGSAIPGPWGAIIGGGAKVVGGLVNAAFGTKVNQEALNAANQGTSYLNNFTSNASSFDEIQGPQAQTAIQDAYKGGWFSKGSARRKNNKLREQRQIAQLFADRSVGNNIGNIAEEQMNNMLANYAAFGGPLHTHGADWTNGITIIDNGGTHESNPFEGVPMGMAPDGQPNLVEEGEVIFNDYVFSNRLKVPKAVREKYKLRGVKDMTFADAAKKAQKESEERPNDPISQRGLEDIMYRLMTEQEAVRESRQQRKYSEGGRIHIAPSKRGTFTAAASKHNMGVQEFASKVLANPEDYSPAMRKKANFARNASKWKHAYGGSMGHYFEGDGPIPQYLNPNTPPQGYGILGLRKYPNYSDVMPKKDYSVLFPNVGGLDFSNIVTDLNKTPSPSMEKLQEDIPHLRGLLSIEDYKKPKNPEDPKTSGLAGLRFVPAIGAGISAFSDLMGWTNRPDYSNAQSIVDAASSIGDVRYTPIGDYMRYTPLDRLFYANQLGAQAGATRRNIINTSGGNRSTAMAGLLSADYNAQEQLGKLFRQAEEYNLGQRERVATFNRGTNMFNAENELKAQIANRDNAKIRVDAAAKAAAIRNAVDERVGAARSANLTNLFDSLGNIGREAATRNMILTNPAIYYDIGANGEITYKNGYKNLSDTAKDEVNRHAAARLKTNAKGGYLTIRRRR